MGFLWLLYYFANTQGPLIISSFAEYLTLVFPPDILTKVFVYFKSIIVIMILQILLFHL